MIKPIKIRKKRVLIDVDTQRDLFLADGAACVRNHRRVLMNIRRISAWARAKNIRVVSTMLDRPGKNGDIYCISGTSGHKKINYTLRTPRLCYEADGYSDIARDMFIHNTQVILKKRTSNPFEEPRLERLLTEMRADEFLVMGAPAEEAVLATVLGLLQRGKKVTIITDAIGAHDRQKADLAVRKMKAKGAAEINTKTIAGSSHLLSTGLCRCKLCTAAAAEQKAHAIA